MCTHRPGEGASAGSGDSQPVPRAHSLCLRHPEGGRMQGPVQRRVGPSSEGHTVLRTLLSALRVDPERSDREGQAARSVTAATVRHGPPEMHRVV